MTSSREEELYCCSHNDNFYRQVERSIDLSFVREVVDKFYASMGHPSIDPVVFFKLQWIDFFEGIRSERQLVVTVKLNLAYRRFLGDHLNEPIPDHISLSRIRGHFGLEVFQRFLEQIVELCIEPGWVGVEPLFGEAKEFIVSGGSA